jgi:hypothetical protein
MDSCNPCAPILVRSNGRDTVCSLANTILPEMRPRETGVHVLVHHKRCVVSEGYFQWNDNVLVVLLARVN